MYIYIYTYKIDIDTTKRLAISCLRFICTDRFDLEATGITDAHLGHMLGNGMTVNVIGRILSRALYSAGLLSEAVANPWEGARDRAG